MSSIQESPATAPGRFGPYGGRYVPEVLMSPLEELERAYAEARQDPAFETELKSLLHHSPEGLHRSILLRDSRKILAALKSG